MKSLDKLARPIIRPAFEQYGFVQADLVAQWTVIVGEDIAARCSPERMTWPRGRDGSKHQSEGATLSVRADNGAGLALSYETQTMIERINAFFGYMAVTKIKVVQGERAIAQKHNRPDLPPPTPEISQAVEVRTGLVEDEKLKSALTRLGEAALTKTKTLS